MGSLYLIFLPACAGGLQSLSTSTLVEAETQPSALEASVQSGILYRCRIRTLAGGAPRGKSSVNLVWAQFSIAVNRAGDEVFKSGSGSYLTVTGPTEKGWQWVGCDPPGRVSPADSFNYFQGSGTTTVRL